MKSIDYIYMISMLVICVHISFIYAFCERNICHFKHLFNLQLITRFIKSRFRKYNNCKLEELLN